MNKNGLPLVGLLVGLLASSSAFGQGLRGAFGLDDRGTDTGWYLRTDVGINSLGSGTPSQADLAANGGSFIDHSLTRTASVDVGVGYRFSPKLRVDATFELRSGSNIGAVDNVRLINGRGQTAADIYSVYRGTLESQALLLNAYYDVGTWNGLTPFLGASVGVARNTVAGLTTSNDATVNIYSNTAPYDLTSQLTEHSNSYSKKRSTYAFAWGLSAGASYAINEKLTVEAAYRYLNLGSTSASDLINCTCGGTGQPFKLGGLDSHDLKVGLRMKLDSPAPVQRSPMPVVAKY